MVSSPEKCHALCLQRRGCSFWTWRGDSSKKCFLRREQGQVVRRAGAVAGSTLLQFGCKHILEERQRSEKSKRVAEEMPFQLRWFEEDPDLVAEEGEYCVEECPAFKFKGNFPEEGHGNLCEVDTTKLTQKDAEALFRPWQFVEGEKSRRRCDRPPSLHQVCTLPRSLLSYLRDLHPRLDPAISNQDLGQHVGRRKGEYKYSFSKFLEMLCYSENR